MRAGSRGLAAALDLGSTLVKSGELDRGRPRAIRALPTPPLWGAAPIREGDGEAYAALAERVLDGLARRLPCGTPLGVASQRSSFLLWERDRGVAATPLVSWQDSRASEWCVRHRDLAAEVSRRTGLVLSGHYAGPKLALMIERDARWGTLLRERRLLFGTLDSYLVWRLTRGRVHEIDLTMAARTALLDLATGGWDPGLLDRFGVPGEAMPRVRSSTPLDVPLWGGFRLRATIADQAAGALALFDPAADVTVVNLGTGGFVLRPTPRGDLRIPGYLTAPILAHAEDEVRYAVEGTINGAGTAVDRFGTGPTELPAGDPTPEAFCLPDSAGLGSPHWRPEISLTFSDAARRLDPADLRRVTLEGLLFRVGEIIADLTESAPAAGRVLVAGGLSREPFLVRGLAALLGRPVERLEVRHGALVGAARLAADLPPHAAARTREIPPGRGGRYLPLKYRRWRHWLADLL